jgi:hypothetical protein
MNGGEYSKQDQQGQPVKTRRQQAHRCIFPSSRIVSTRAQQTATRVFKVRDPYLEGSTKHHHRAESCRVDFQKSVHRSRGDTECGVRGNGKTRGRGAGSGLVVPPRSFLYKLLYNSISYSILGSATKAICGCVGGIIADFDRHPSVATSVKHRRCRIHRDADRTKSSLLGKHHCISYDFNKY